MGDKYPILRPNEIISILLKKGSHAKYINGHRVTIVPIHDTVARGTLRSILIQAGIELEEFLKLL
jgi:predicted RNA binding protein YcfA (HicA-like mRNA interferase family)